MVKLDNGLPVMYKKYPIDSFSMVFVVNYGSLYESKKENGIAHFLEHLLTKQTKNIPSEKLKNRLFDNAIFWNAMTGYEQIQFLFKAHKSKFDTIASTLSDILINPNIDEKAVRLERGPVITEMRGGDDKSPDAVASSKITRAVLGEHPATFTVADSMRALRNYINVSKVKDTYSKYFTPDNSVLSVTGGIELEKMLPVVNDLFGSWSGKFSGKTLSPAEYLPPSRRTFRLRGVDESMVVLGKGLPPASKQNYDDVNCLTIANSLLVKSLMLELREKTGITYTPSSDNSHMTSFGINETSVSAFSPKYLNLIENTILTEIDKLYKGEISHEAVEKVKENTVLSGLVSLGEESFEIAEELGMAYAVLKDPTYPEALPHLFESITMDDMRRVCSNHLNPDDFSVVVLKPYKKC